MIVWLPRPLYQVFPIIWILIGFLVVALIQNPVGIALAAGLYIYAFIIMLIRLSSEKKD